MPLGTWLNQYILGILGWDPAVAMEDGVLDLELTCSNSIRTK